jgi:sugar phosphate isomerase/epimerase
MKLGIEFQTVFAMPPDELVELASELDCGSVGVVIASFGYNPDGYSSWSLRDAAVKARMASALEKRGVTISLGDGFVVLPGHDVREIETDLDIMIDLGCKRINTAAIDLDVPRCLDQFGILIEMAAARGVVTTLEFAPSLAIKDMNGAMEAVRHVGRPNDFKLLIDTMHFVRSGSKISDLAQLDPTVIGYVHLSDNTLQQRGDTYREDSQDRLPPGEGELPLREIIELIPDDVVISVEIPMQSRAEAGERTRERVRRAVEASRSLLIAVRGPGATD